MTDAPRHAGTETSETPVETLERLATLARLHIPEERKEALAAEFEQVIGYIAQLNELDIRRDVAQALPTLHNAFREDANPNPTDVWSKEIVGAFPAESDGALVVKKIISHD